ncbi:Histidine triad nucleotide-binding protein 3 [Leucoagaricus sp. SymC.cos]|nr:Histidine triad nucleotide-binding protein 3 [Leucoagaricus sp. SymC.cos]
MNLSCEFCAVSAERGFSIIYEDSDFVAFTDIAPAARLHIQVVPKRHHDRSLSFQDIDIPIVQSMQRIGDKILNDHEISPSMRRMGFHIPPFNSIDHLHLHVQGGPYTSPLRDCAYPISKGRGSNHKGLSWFVEAKQAIQILESGRQIGILPC